MKPDSSAFTKDYRRLMRKYADRERQRLQLGKEHSGVYKLDIEAMVRAYLIHRPFILGTLNSPDDEGDSWRIHSHHKERPFSEGVACALLYFKSQGFRLQRSINVLRYIDQWSNPEEFQEPPLAPSHFLRLLRSQEWIVQEKPLARRQKTLDAIVVSSSTSRV